MYSDALSPQHVTSPGAARAIQRHVCASDGVDRVFGRAQLDPTGVTRGPQRHRGVRELVDSVHQPQQLGLELVATPARLGLVLQSARQAKQRHGRGTAALSAGATVSCVIVRAK